MKLVISTTLLIGRTPTALSRSVIHRGEGPSVSSLIVKLEYLGHNSPLSTVTPTSWWMFSAWNAENIHHDVGVDRKSTRLNSSHVKISYAVFCLKKKKKNINTLKICIIECQKYFNGTRT